RLGQRGLWGAPRLLRLAGAVRIPPPRAPGCTPPPLAPPPRRPPPPPPPPPAPEHTLTVRAACDPCTVNVGQSSTVTATVMDSISCAVTYRWSAPTGTFANPTDRQTLWTAPQQEGQVPVTVTVPCPTANKMGSDPGNLP